MKNLELGLYFFLYCTC